MPAKRYLVVLSTEHRKHLEAIVHTGARKVFPRRRARCNGAATRSHSRR